LLAAEGVKIRGNRVLAERAASGRKSLDALLWKL
jgi:hypothetical protein